MRDHLVCATTSVNKHILQSLLIPIVLAAISGCGELTDAATRLASDIEAGADHLGSEPGATYTIEHKTPSYPGQCTGPYTVQLDKVGALIIWCKDSAGETTDSHSTSYHSRFVDTPRTRILDKPAGSTLIIDLERQNGRAAITDVR